MKSIVILLLSCSMLVSFNYNTLAVAKDSDTRQGIKDGGNVFVPFIAYEPETKFMLGTYFMHYYDQANGAKTDVLNGRVIVTQEEQLSLNLGIDRHFCQQRYRYRSNLTYSLWNNDFYGIGNQDEEREGENFESVILKFDSGIFKKFGNNLYFGPMLHFNRYRIKDKTTGGLLEKNTVSGSEGATLLGETVTLMWDERDSSFWPTKGFVLETRAGVFTSVSDDEDFDFSHFDCDYRFYKAITERRKVWAFQARMQLNNGDIPFQFLPSLGGSNLMRGCPSGKYADENLIAFQTEYRYPINQKYSGTVFVGFGEVAHDVEEFTWDEVKVAYGAGVRIAVDQATKMNMRFDLGFSPSDHGFYFMIGEAF